MDDIHIEQRIQGERLVEMRDEHGRQLRQIQEEQTAQGEQLAKMMDDQQLFKDQILCNESMLRDSDKTQQNIAGKALYSTK